MKTSTFAPFAKPLYVMVKPVGAVCNLACDYCYYLEKANLYKDNLKHVMSDELLEKFIDEYINSQTMPQVLFTWHGGETLMRPLSFYKKAMELQKKYARGRTIDNCIQTNGTMLTDEWCEFFRENNWLVGVSIDGPQEFHDEYRKNKMGKPSFVKVMQGINLLKKHAFSVRRQLVHEFQSPFRRVSESRIPVRIVHDNKAPAGKMFKNRLIKITGRGRPVQKKYHGPFPVFRFQPFRIPHAVSIISVLFFFS